MSVSASEQKICPDCGPATVNHRVEWFSALLDSALSPILGVCDSIWRKLGASFYRLPLARLALPLFRILTALHLGTLANACDEKDNLRTKALWESADKRGIKMWQFRFFGNSDASVLVARSRNVIRVFDGLPRVERMPSASLKWMDNKGVMKKKFLAVGIPVAKGGSCFTIHRALEIFRSVEKPVIVKPHIGSRSRHTFVHIADEKILEIAFRKAKQLSPWVMVEEELIGMVFRASVVAGKLTGVIRREPPHVIGDGVSTARVLTEADNKNPHRLGPIFHIIPMDEEADEELRRQGLMWNSVPAQGTFVALNQKVSRSYGATTSDMTPATHPANVELFEKIARVLGDSLVGIDFIIDDISRPWMETKRCGVIECNSLPFLDLHHYPFKGTPRDAAGALLDAVFPIVTRSAETVSADISIHSSKISKNSSRRASIIRSKK